MKKRFTLALALLLIVAALPFALFGCAKDEKPRADYTVDNSYSVASEDGEDRLVYYPEDVAPSYGLIFYVGTAISPTNYAYLGEALARQGYLAVFPKTLLAYYMYQNVEAAYEAYGDVKFFLGGHSQGGGAAIRRASENADKTLGLVLLAPLCYTLSGGMFDGSDPAYDVSFHSVADSPIPSLILHAEGDRVLTAKQQSAVTECVDTSLSERHVISPGAHMSFSTWDNDAMLKMFGGDGNGITEEQKQAQRDLTVSYVLSFLKRIVAAL